MRPTETLSPDMCDTLRTSPSLEVAAVTQPPLPVVGDANEEINALTTFPPAPTTLDAIALVGCTEEHKTTRNCDEGDAVEKEGTNTLFSVEGATESRTKGGSPFRVDTEAEEQDGSPQHSPNDSRAGDEKEQQKVDDGDDPDAARGSVIQDKYSITSKWVESLPQADSCVFLNEPIQEVTTSEATAAASGVVDRKHRQREEGAKNGQAKGGRGDRKRRAQEKAENAELQAAFKNSQRTLRKQAKCLTLRDVFSRTCSLPSSSPVAIDAPGSPFSFPPNKVLAGSSINGNDADIDLASPLGTGVSSPSSLPFHSSAFSPATLVSPSSPSSSSAWSPDLVGELTNRFLARVHQQKRQKFEQMVSRELTQSQTLSQTQSLTQHPRENGGSEVGNCGDDNEGTPHTHKDSAMANNFRTPLDELVIGEEENEATNWMPADSLSSTSQHARRIMQRDPVTGNEMMLLGASSSDEGQFLSLCTTPAESRKAEEEAASQQQEKVMKSLARKHEIWKLKQRQLRAQEQVELDERAKAIQQQKSAKSLAPSTSTLSSVSAPSTGGEADSSVRMSATGSSAASAPFFTGMFRTYATTEMGVYCSNRSGDDGATAAVRSRQLAKLSAHDISMIRRSNSFDNTSTQRVVVFGTAAAKQTRGEETQH
ncbi:hypothetical protein, conserved [Leishmania tarentolae]|uniref:Uncharacterized protein n=1 Tax=Leishmania tarentolae TaxID=5689 RepID=A0A640KSQ5_LEITA|nr:hypothetical protein, conserved [Leishmania tarentolae]